jgi:hypothetical protein
MSDNDKDPLEAAGEIVAGAEWNADIAEDAEELLADTLADLKEFAGTAGDASRLALRSCAYTEVSARRIIALILGPVFEQADVPDPYTAVGIVVDNILAISDAQHTRADVFLQAVSRKRRRKTATKAKKK